MADKYRRVEKSQEVLPPNEIRVKRKVGIGRYLKRANDLFGENAHNCVIIKGVSNAVESAVKLAELIKHRIAGLHQVNKISHITILDEYEPLEEGLDHLKFTRIVTMLEIKLSKQALDTKDIGYQPPISDTEVQAYSERLEGQTPNGDERPARRRRNNSGRRNRGGKRGDAANPLNAKTDNEETPKDNKPRERRPQTAPKEVQQPRSDAPQDANVAADGEKPRNRRHRKRKPTDPNAPPRENNREQNATKPEESKDEQQRPKQERKPRPPRNNNTTEQNEEGKPVRQNRPPREDRQPNQYGKDNQEPRPPRQQQPRDNQNQKDEQYHNAYRGAPLRGSGDNRGRRGDNRGGNRGGDNRGPRPQNDGQQQSNRGYRGGQRGSTQEGGQTPQGNNQAPRQQQPRSDQPQRGGQRNNNNQGGQNRGGQQPRAAPATQSQSIYGQFQQDN